MEIIFEHKMVLALHEGIRIVSGISWSWETFVVPLSFIFTATAFPEYKSQKCDLNRAD